MASDTADEAWTAIWLNETSSQIEAEYQGSLLDLLKEIRVQLNEGFDVLDDQELDEDTSAMVWNALDSCHDELSYVINELSQD
jgi:hypothetical protein